MLKTTPTLAALALAVTPALAQTSARYEVRFDATWSAQTHPGAYPGGAHFSPLIGGTHSAAADFWEPGTLASNAIEVMAETGNPGPLGNLIDNEISNGNAGVRIQGSTFNSPGVQTREFLITEDHPLVTLVTMIAPSPDWFVGVDSVSLLENGQWVDVTITLYAWDSGTDSGTNFNSPNSDTNPPDPIALITGGPFFGDDPLGTFTFTRLPLGTNYCGPAIANSTGASASIFATGSGIAGETLTLTANDLPTNEFGYFLVSSTQGLVSPPGSSGVLCLGGNIGRFNRPGEVGNSGPGGSFFLVADSSALPQSPPVSALPGETWNFQAWFRDGSGDSNFTDGVSITFQ